MTPKEEQLILDRWQPTIRTPFEPDDDAVTMQEIQSDLDDALIGQTVAKKAAAQIIWSTFSRLGASTSLFIGRTGCGKTELWRAVAKQYKKTVHFADASKLTSEGYKGDYKVSDILKSIPDDGRPHILVIDELCKLIDKNGDHAYHLMIQDELLRLFDHDDRDKLTVVCLGAFAPIYEQKQPHNSIGFSTTVSNKEEAISITVQDLIDYGFKPELVGRFDRIVMMDELSEETMLRIVHDMISKMQAKLQKEINISDADAERIASEAFECGLGARGVRSRLRCMIEDYIYEYPYAEVIDLSEKYLVAEM